LGWAVGALLLLLLVAFVAVGARTLTMLFGAEPSTLPAARPAAVRAGTSTGVLPLGVGLLALAVLGLATWPLEHLLRAAAPSAGTS
jgi:hydrogenase-4 component F